MGIKLMTRPMHYEFNVETQEETIREMNDAEFAQYQIDKAESDKQEQLRLEEEAKLAAKAAAKAQALAALGLSQEIINLLAD
jgi:hypothetical protein